MFYSLGDVVYYLNLDNVLDKRNIFLQQVNISSLFERNLLEIVNLQYFKFKSHLACAAEAAAAAAPFNGIFAEWAFKAAWIAIFFSSRSAYNDKGECNN